MGVKRSVMALEARAKSEVTKRPMLVLTPEVVEATVPLISAEVVSS